MAFSDYEHCHYCVADKEAGRALPGRHGYKGLYVGDTEVPDHINVICSHHLMALQDEIATLCEREAQHLADIKALREALSEGYALSLHARDRVLKATAHYDDAKAVCVVDGCEKPRETAFRCCDHVIDGDIGAAWSDDAKADAAAEDWQAWANGSCPEPGCSLANPHEQGVACVKPTDAEGGEG